MHSAGFPLREVLKQHIQNVGRLVGSTGDEVTELRNVVVGDVGVSNATGRAVTDVMFGE